MADRIQQRRDTAARWAQYNPVLLEGEVGYVTDNPNQYKIGDGIHAWNDLPLRGYTGTIAQKTGRDENAVMSQKATSEAIHEIYGAINNFVRKDDSVADFNIGDEEGNVLLQLEGGDIRTKEFNSRRAVTRKNDDSKAQLNIGDEEGNVLLQLKNGHIKTKYFDSENIDRSSVGLLQRFTLPTIPAQNGTDTSHQFFNLAQGNPQAQWIYDWYTPLIERSNGYITKEILGKDSSGLYDIWRLTLQPKYTISHNGQLSPVGTYPIKTSRKVVMVANIHGDPYDPIDAAFTLFWLCKFLVDEYDTNEVARYLRDNYTFIIIPIANPWGMDNRSYGTYNGVQINRNYPYHFVANQPSDNNTTTGPYPLSEKESQYINATLIDNLDSYAYFDIHSYGKTVHTKTFYNPINDPFGFNKQRVLSVFHNTASLINGVKLGMYDDCDFDGWGPGYVVHKLGIWTPFLECNSFLDGVTGDEALQFSSGALTSNFYDLVGLLMFDK